MGWGGSAEEGKEWEMWESGMGNLAVRIGTSCVDGIGARRGSRQAHQSIPMERSYAMGKGKEDCDTGMIMLMSKEQIRESHTDHSGEWGSGQGEGTAVGEDDIRIGWDTSAGGQQSGARRRLHMAHWIRQA